MVPSDLAFSGPGGRRSIRRMCRAQLRHCSTFSRCAHALSTAALTRKRRSRSRTTSTPHHSLITVRCARCRGYDRRSTASDVCTHVDRPILARVSHGAAALNHRRGRGSARSPRSWLAGWPSGFGKAPRLGARDGNVQFMGNRRREKSPERDLHCVYERLPLFEGDLLSHMTIF